MFLEADIANRMGTGQQMRHEDWRIKILFAKGAFVILVFGFKHLTISLK